MVILERDLLACPALSSLRSTKTEGSSNGTTQGERGATADAADDGAAEDSKELSLPGVSVWVTSEYVSRCPTEYLDFHGSIRSLVRGILY